MNKATVRVVKHKKDSGRFFTPSWVVDFMVGLIDESALSFNLKILEPACGICQFLHGIKQHRPHLLLRGSGKGVEVDRSLVEHARGKYGNRLEIVHADFLLWNTAERFDVIIGNPPYGIPSPSDHYSIRIDNRTKEKYKKLYETWRGKYNLYGAFIEKSIKILKDGGQLIFIVPATFMILDEFKRLREFLARNGDTEIIYMGSHLFRPEADVTVVVLRFVKSLSHRGRLSLYEYEDGNIRCVLRKEDWDGSLVLFSTEFTRKLEDICSFRIGDVFLIRISPRTPEIRKNPYVIRGGFHQAKSGMLPILNSKNLKVGEVVYRPMTGYWIEEQRKTQLRSFFANPHVVVGLGFRKKGQLGAAYDRKAYPWMGDVYHLLRVEGLAAKRFNLQEEEIVEFLNSAIMAKYIREIFRDITYHFNITQLKILPLPTRDELKTLQRMGI